MLPAAQQIPTRQLRVRIDDNLGRRRIQCIRGCLPGNLAVHVTLKREGILSVLIPIRSEPRLAHSPIVKIATGIPALRMKLRTASEANAVDTIVEAPVIPAAV